MSFAPWWKNPKNFRRGPPSLWPNSWRAILPSFPSGFCTDRCRRWKKDDVMRRFRANEIQLLVATTVIEVGVDVPNAVVMIIEDADRFGLAQLHQLRGRVGRGQHESFCVLLADPATPDGQTRMRVLCETGDGFRIAEEDLRLRGPGEFYGVRQSGLAGLKIADVLRDRDLLMQARDDAFSLIDADPKLAKAENRGLRRMVLSARNAAQTEAAGVA